MMNEPGWLSETATAIVSVIAASAAGRMLFVGYQLRDSERRVVAIWLFFEFFVAMIMGLLTLGAVDVIQQVFEIDLYGWPAFSLAAISGWLGPRGMQGLFNAFVHRGKK